MYKPTGSLAWLLSSDAPCLPHVMYVVAWWLNPGAT